MSSNHNQEMLQLPISGNCQVQIFSNQNNQNSQMTPSFEVHVKNIPPKEADNNVMINDAVSLNASTANATATSAFEQLSSMNMTPFSFKQSSTAQQSEVGSKGNS